jgi:hypothetical protein
MSRFHVIAFGMGSILAAWHSGSAIEQAKAAFLVGGPGLADWVAGIGLLVVALAAQCVLISHLAAKLPGGKR